MTKYNINNYNKLNTCSNDPVTNEYYSEIKAISRLILEILDDFINS